MQDSLRRQEYPPFVTFMQVRPVYPPELRGSGLEPTFIIEAVSGTDGHVVGAVEKGNVNVGASPPIDPLFVNADLDAVRQWRYNSALLNGIPAEISTTITVAFKR